MTYIQVEISEVEEKIEAPNRLFYQLENIDYHETADEIVDRLQHLYKPKVEFELSHVRITSTPHGDGNQGYVAIYLLRMIIIIFINFLELSKPNSLKCLYS